MARLGRRVSPITECYNGMQLWKKLGWIPYCPKSVRKHMPFIKWYIPYNAMRRLRGE